MRKLTLFILLISFSVFAHSQDAKSIVTEGIELHDAGKYEEAIQKYNAAIQLDKNYYLAYYEKSLTLLTIKKYEDCISICKYLLKNFKDGEENAAVYMNYGTCLDLLGKSKQAVEVYNDGIKAFPNVGLLYFNKAVTLVNMNEVEKATESATMSIKNNPYHGSSHHVMSILQSKQNKVYGLMASLVLLAIEPEGKRAPYHLNNVQTILGANVKKTGENSVSITLDASAFDDKKGKSENNFRPIEVTMSLVSALNFDDKYKNETAAQRLERNLESVFGMLDEREGTGFGWTYYAPFFVKLKKAGYLNTFSHLILSTANDADNNAWLQDHKDKVQEFDAWFKEYWQKG